MGQDHSGIAAPAGHAVLVYSGQEYSNEKRPSRKCRGLAKNEAAHEHPGKRMLARVREGAARPEKPRSPILEIAVCRTFSATGVDALDEG